MNPTDQARKEARKRELKKNKKQRQMVRAAVLKGKDPNQIINDLEKIDEMEYNVSAPPLLNEKVLKDKRKKLKETWERVMRLYYKEDRERYCELKKLETEYESRRSILVKYYESVRYAQQVQVDEIPLPATPNMPLFLTSQIPLPNELELPLIEPLIPQSILKKTSVYHPLKQFATLQPPGVPPGPPPDLSSDEEEEAFVQGGENEEERGKDKENKQRKSRTIRFADESDIDSGEDDGDDKEQGDRESSDEEEEESTAKQYKHSRTGLDIKDTEKNKEERAFDSDEEEHKDAEENGAHDSDDERAVKSFADPSNIPVPPVHTVPLPAGPPPSLPQGPPPASVPVMFRPPPLRPGLPPPPRLLPPGIPPPPPGRPTLPHGPPPGLPLRVGAPPIRLPPGPPPGIPPARLIRPPVGPPPTITVPPPGISVPPPGLPVVTTTPETSETTVTTTAAITVLSAPPSLMQRPKQPLPAEETARSATIEAKPQIRTLSADVMRFMPTTLRIKREDRHKKGVSKGGSAFEQSKDVYPAANPMANPSVTAPTKDDAYQQFLKEMEEFL